MNKIDIIKALPKLSSQDRDDIAVAIKAIAQMGAPAAPRDTRGDRDPLLSAIASYLGRLGLITAGGPTGGLEYRSAYEIYRKKRPEVITFLTKLHPAPGGRIMPQVTFLAASALGDLLNSRRIFGVPTMLSQIDKIPEALDAAFPGYVSAGLFSFILINTNERNIPEKRNTK